MPDKIATKVVCEICNHDIQEDLETITMNGYDYTFCIDSRACVLREKSRIFRSEDEDGEEKY